MKAWATEWAAMKASEALRYLATSYPEASGSPDLHSRQDAAHAAAVAGDREAYLEALRAFMGAGRGVAMRERLEAQEAAA